jgi:hypothetical protein
MSSSGNLAMSVLAGLIGLAGLYFASRALDTGFYIFGLALAAFAVIYIFTAIKRAYDEG